ncbi:SEC14-like protein 3 [Nephila pilipes]|uniref:SEC14-like protein 3 n=1 Tax=Nephila pilipes TaxID=299642 RepID=A0A8X6PYH5_NEPPI|nr:SEC14-like protein 3 [Nephila pilipes]
MVSSVSRNELKDALDPLIDALIESDKTVSVLKGTAVPLGADSWFRIPMAASLISKGRNVEQLRVEENCLKEAVADVHKPSYDDYYYLRWLRAREFDVAKAETMMRKNIAFRKKIGADTILENYVVPELVDKCYPRGYIGPDKEGCPVRYMPFKNLDLRGFAYSVKKSDVLKFLTYIFEYDIKEMEELSKKTGKGLEALPY